MAVGRSPVDNTRVKRDAIVQSLRDHDGIYHRIHEYGIVTTPA